MRTNIVVMSLCLLLLTPETWGGQIEPQLQQRLRAVSGDAYVPIVIRLSDRVDTRALDGSLKVRRATRAERNYEVVTALRRKAAETQGPLLAYLEEQARTRDVMNYESYWIDNLIMATATPRVIAELAVRQDVEMIFLEQEIMIDPPLDFEPEGDRIAAAEPGLRAINAPALWRAGITGRGRLVMNIDTGVNGNHQALSSRWRGTLPGVLWNHAWYGSGTFPTDSDNPGHGTHTMGTMTGRNAAALDTLGVAPDAYWIAGTGSYVGAFQWAADPDGNPFTVNDVPDVVNCSWFTSGDLCFGGSTYWALMDNVELAGAAVIWSAGNCGPTGSPGSCTGGAVPGPYMTITPPKNRIATDINAFAVGALDGNNPAFPIAGFSSRGPSACDTTVIKPEVTAPGSSVRSTIANGGYGNLSGTSMAAPHVAGAVALLRQVNPNATVDDVKHALLNTATDLGIPGEDNTYGKGIINVLAAAEVVTPYRLSGVVRNASNGQPINLAKVEILQTYQERRTNTSGSYQLGVLRDTVQIRFSAFGFYDSTFSRILQANVPETLNVSLQSLPLANISGTITDSISAAGIIARVDLYGIGDPSPDPTRTTVSQSSGSYVVTAPIGTYRIEVFPAAPYVDRVVTQNVPLPVSGTTVNYRLLASRMLLVDDDAGAAFQTAYQSSLERLNLTYRTFSVADSGTHPGGVLAAYASPPVMLWFTGNDTTNALTAGERQAIIDHLSRRGRVIVTGQYIAEFSSPTDPLLAGQFGIQFNGNTVLAFLSGFAGDVIGNGIAYLVTGGINAQTSKDMVAIVPGSAGTPTKTLYYGTAAADTANIAGVRVVGPNGWAATFFGFGIEGLSASRVDTLVLRSMRYFDQTPVSVGEAPVAGIPREFMLAQNYPNPFNPVTTIRYGLPVQSRVTLTIYNLVGQEVARIVRDMESAGYHEATWNGTNASGTPVASGLYFYRLEAIGADGETPFVATRKLLLLK